MMADEPYISSRTRSNLTSSKLAEVRSYCFHNQYDPDKNPDGVIALAVAENKLMRDEITRYINENTRIRPWHLTYGEGPQGSTELLTELVQFVNREFHPFEPTENSHICVCNGAGNAVSQFAFCVGEPGDGILVGRPLYVGFFPDIENHAKTKAVLVSFGTIDPLSPESAACYENALLESNAAGTTIRALLISNPHNPLGRPYPAETLIAYLKVCAKHNIHLLSDEVYCKSNFPSTDFLFPPPFISVLSLDLHKIINPALVHIIYAMSKDFCANGIRIGALITPFNPTLFRAFRSIATFTRPSHLAEVAWLSLLRATSPTGSWCEYFDLLESRMTESYNYTTSILKQHAIPYTSASSTSFIWLDLSRYLPQPPSFQAELDLNLRMAHEARIWLAAGQSFGAEAFGWYRLTFASPREELEEGLMRLARLLGTVESERMEGH